MKILPVSDLHTNFHKDNGLTLFKEMAASEPDVLVIAGDISECQDLFTAILKICELFPQIVYIPGNHEYYLADRGQVNRVKEKVKNRCPNFHWIDEDFVVIDGQKFVGATVWFPHQAAIPLHEREHGDFHYIRGFRNWYNDVHHRSMKFLWENVTPDSIVVTHNAPSKLSSDGMYADNIRTDLFYVSAEAGHLLEKKQPRMWIHGHMHTSKRYMIGSTEVIVNAFGYAGYQENPKFDSKLLIDLSCAERDIDCLSE